MDIKSFSASTGETHSTKNRYRDILPCELDEIGFNTISPKKTLFG